MLKCAVQMGAVLLQIVESQAKAAPFAVGGIIPPETVGINQGPRVPDVVLHRGKQSVENALGQGIATLLPDHEANQKKETR